MSVLHYLLHEGARGRQVVGAPGAELRPSGQRASSPPGTRTLPPPPTLQLSMNINSLVLVASAASRIAEQ